MIGIMRVESEGARESGDGLSWLRGKPKREALVGAMEQKCLIYLMAGQLHLIIVHV